MQAYLLRTLSLSCLLAALGATGCAADDNATTGDEDLTSLSARQRSLAFEGVVYVDPRMSEARILEKVHEQTKTAFGALLHANIAAQTREFQNVDPASLNKRIVRVVDTSVAGDTGREMLEVRYTYRDSALVPVTLSRKTSLSLSLVGQGYEPRLDELIVSCTKNDKEARDDANGGLLWYVFDPQRASCGELMDREQKAIDRDTAKLADSRTMVPLSRVNRALVPVTMQLSRADTATRATYPEYDRLFTGASEPGVLKIVMLNGRIAHDRVEAKKDDGYFEWMDALGVVFEANPDFALTKIEPNEEIANVTVAGRRYENLGFKDFIQWTVYGNGWPQGMPTSSRDDLARTIANRLDNHWVTFEKKVKISVGGAAPKDLVIRLETLFGVDEEPEPHRRALRNGDVFIYNGHSNIGEGPLDPANYRSDSFSRGYQMLWFDSCVSYNYYNKDFFSLKPGGSQELDIIVNGLEAPSWQSGAANGAFINKLIGGEMPSYQSLLGTATSTDSLRVVDGEIDNRFDPRQRPVRLVR